MTESAYIDEFITMGEAKGRVEEIRSRMLRLGAKRFGAASAAIKAAIHAISDLERLERICDQILDAAD